jgi:ABC-type bacteriocin/lantibiotic exporter with double-glycine peptidase domain
MPRYTLKNLLGTLMCSHILLFAAGSPGVWLDVPFVKQEKNGCGAATIAMVMQYWQRQQGQPADRSIDAEQIQRALYANRAHGIYASDLEHYLQQYGFRTFIFQARLDDLKHHLAKGRPLIVALKPGSGDTALHYAVVTGLDWERRLVLKNDPAERKLLKQGESDFEREWKAAGNWTLLAVPQQGGPPSSPSRSSR